ncbi:MAG: hypothetical protein NTW29_03060 [Bacteroidetes bacterium]|nr:hypothetical protein [Bacteroidota bacterium]
MAADKHPFIQQNDLRHLLLYGGNESAGANNFMGWVLMPKNNATFEGDKNDEAAYAAHLQYDTMVSLHEYAHDQLNITSVYGAVLMATAYLCKERKDLRTVAEEVLGELVDRCYYSHEMYATWNSLYTLFADEGAGFITTHILSDNPEYLEYFEKADAIVASIPTLQLKGWVLLSFINFCFQSKGIALHAEENITSNWIGAIDEKDFPDKRRELLEQHFPPEKLKALLDHFLATTLQNEFVVNGAVNYSGVHEYDIEEAVLIFTKLNEFLQKEFALVFSSYGLESFIADSHLAYNQRLVSGIYEIYRPDSGTKYTYFVPDKNDHVRLLMLQFESEDVLFTRLPVFSKVVLPEDIGDQLWNGLYTSAAGLAYFIVWVRPLHILEEQYPGLSEADRQLLRGMGDVITFTRKVEDTEEGRHVSIIPFASPSALDTRLHELPEETQTLAVAAFSAYGFEQWSDTWGDYLNAQLSGYLHLNDISIVYLAEQFLADKQDVRYDHFLVLHHNTFFGFICIRYTEGENAAPLFISPCSDAYYAYLTYYFSERFPTYREERGMATPLLPFLTPVALGMVEEERFFSFKNAVLGGEGHS